MTKQHHVSIPEFAEIIGRDAKTIRRWIGEGMPELEKGRRGKPAVLDSVACIEWHVSKEKGALDINPVLDEKHRLTKAQREKMEHDLALARGEAIPVDVVRAAVAKIFTTIRSTMTAISNRLAKGDNEFRLELLSQTYETLEEIQSEIAEQFSVEPDEAGDGGHVIDSEATTNKNSKPVGRSKKSSTRRKR